jgi:uncharacterized membrane protein YkoI
MRHNDHKWAKEAVSQANKKDPRDTQELKQKNSVRHKLRTLPLEKARWTGQKASKGRAKSQKIVNKLVHHRIRHENVF